MQPKLYYYSGTSGQIDHMKAFFFLFAAKTKYYMGVGRQYISMEEHSTVILFAVIEEIRPTRTRNKKDGAQSG